MRNRPYALLMAGLFLCNTSLMAQQAKTDKTLFQVGVASGFIGGLYHSIYPDKELKKYGDFGLGAPDKLDGEMVMLHGKIYQTQSTGKTFEVKDTGSTALSFVNFFHADQQVKLPHAMSRTQLYSYLDSLLSNQNGIYAIHVQGNFESVKTRAFPPPTMPYKPLAEMLDKQSFFTFNHIAGDLVGYRLPLYLEALSIHGYHFHFLSSDKTGGGHIIDFLVTDAVVEIHQLDHYDLVVPDNKDFNQFNFSKDRKEELKSVENGKK